MLHHLKILLFPLIFSNIIHMVLVKYDVLPFLKIPVSTRLFGQNKTWRGFILLAFLNGVITPFFAQDIPAVEAFFLGAALGLAYMVSELPNSFFKRKMGIGPGESPSKNKLFFSLLDKTDSAFGTTLAYFLIRDIPLAEAAELFLIGSAAHILFSFFLVSLKIKKSF